MIGTRRSKTPGIWEVAETQSLSERARDYVANNAAESGADVLLLDLADALDAKDIEIGRLRTEMDKITDVLDAKDAAIAQAAAALEDAAIRMDFEGLDSSEIHKTLAAIRKVKP